MGIVPVTTYLSLVTNVYKSSGGIEGQRAPLKTKTGITIRKRMVDDIAKGTVLPPIVIGAVVGDDMFDRALTCNSNNDFVEILSSIPEESLSVIDGMQRTTALIDAAKSASRVAMQEGIRIDLWLAKSVNSLVYRMLILNTGQVAWDIKRQLATIYKNIITTVQREVGDISVINIDEKERRSSPGQYRSTRIVELFLAFTSRKPHVELKERVAEDFARMDATEATSHDGLLPAFIFALTLLVRIDNAFSTQKMNGDFVTDASRFKEGKDIFTSAPASIGFIAAISQALLGKPGYEFGFAEFDNKKESLERKIVSVCAKATSNQPPDDFIDFLTLNEKITAKSGRIGEFERELFFRAFSTMLEDAEELKTLTPCWSAYR